MLHRIAIAFSPLALSHHICSYAGNLILFPLHAHKCTYVWVWKKRKKKFEWIHKGMEQKSAVINWHEMRVRSKKIKCEWVRFIEHLFEHIMRINRFCRSALFRFYFLFIPTQTQSHECAREKHFFFISVCLWNDTADL